MARNLNYHIRTVHARIFDIRQVWPVPYPPSLTSPISAKFDQSHIRQVWPVPYPPSLTSRVAGPIWPPISCVHHAWVHRSDVECRTCAPVASTREDGAQSCLRYVCFFLSVRAVYGWFVCVCIQWCRCTFVYFVRMHVRQHIHTHQIFVCFVHIHIRKHTHAHRISQCTYIHEIILTRRANNAQASTLSPIIQVSTHAKNICTYTYAYIYTYPHKAACMLQVRLDICTLWFHVPNETVYTYIYVYIYTYIHTYAHTHTHTQLRACSK